MTEEISIKNTKNEIDAYDNELLEQIKRSKNPNKQEKRFTTDRNMAIKNSSYGITQSLSNLQQAINICNQEIEELNEKQLQLNTDLFINVSHHIDEICTPLKKVGINHFCYLKNFDDGSQINLSNSGLWLEHYYKFNLYKSSLFEYDPSKYEAGFLVWPNESNLEVFQHGRTYFDSSNGITVVENGTNYCEFYFFSGSINDTKLINFYINNLDFLKNFICFFKFKACDILNNIEKNRIFKKHYKNMPQGFEEFIFVNKNTKMLFNNLEENFKVNNSDNLKDKIMSSLTSREIDITTHLASGKTAKEIAKSLAISFKTVEKHLEHIKAKLECRNKTEIISKLLGIVI